jgi:hypothetical protein
MLPNNHWRLFSLFSLCSCLVPSVFCLSALADEVSTPGGMIKFKRLDGEGFGFKDDELGEKRTRANGDSHL